MLRRKVNYRQISILHDALLTRISKQVNRILPH